MKTHEKEQIELDVITNDQHLLGRKLLVQHLPVKVKVLKYLAEHTYLIGYNNDNTEYKRWNAFGSDSGGKDLADTSVDRIDSVDLNTVDYIMTEEPCTWPKKYYAVVGVCWNLCNRGLYFTHKTVHKIKHYHIVEAYFGTYGLDDDSICFRHKSRKAKKLYSWTKARKAIEKNCRWQGKPIDDKIMASSANNRIRLYHEYFGELSNSKKQLFAPEEKWNNYLNELIKLHFDNELDGCDTNKIDEIINLHENRRKLIESGFENIKEEDEITYLENHFNELLDQYKAILTDEEYSKLLNASKEEKFCFPQE